jgi:hypothetical protein
MYSRRRQNLIGRAGGVRGVPRRQLLYGAGAIGLVALSRPTTMNATHAALEKKHTTFVASIGSASFQIG